MNSRWTEPSLQSALDRCRVRYENGIHCTIAFLGGCAQTYVQASQAVKTYLDIIKLLNQQKLDASITVKPTTLGMLVDKVLCTEHVLSLFRKAMALNVGFEVATEGKNTAQYTVDTAVACAKEKHGVTLALQAYLDRTPDDLKIALENGIRPRLVKGAYVGDTDDYVKIQRRFKNLAQIVLENKQPLFVGTHDPELIRWIMQRADSNRQFIEFGFLKGLADNTKVDLARHGWNVLEYIPFGKDVEAYESRRWSFLKELGRLGKVPMP